MKLTHVVNPITYKGVKCGTEYVVVELARLRTLGLPGYPMGRDDGYRVQVRWQGADGLEVRERAYFTEQAAREHFDATLRDPSAMMGLQPAL